MDKQAIIESLKELGRVLFFAALTAGIGWLSAQISAFEPDSLYYIVGTLILRVLDKYIHESETTERTGVAPF